MRERKPLSRRPNRFGKTRERTRSRGQQCEQGLSLSLYVRYNGSGVKGTVASRRRFPYVETGRPHRLFSSPATLGAKSNGIIPTSARVTTCLLLFTLLGGREWIEQIAMAIRDFLAGLRLVDVTHSNYGERDFCLLVENRGCCVIATVLRGCNRSSY